MCIKKDATMIREFLEKKYGQFITNKFLTDKNEVIYDNFNKDGKLEQEEVISFLKSCQDFDGVKLVPDNFWEENVEWGFDFSSWIGNIKNKDFLFIGAEPHIGNNYQLVYDFGNFKNKSLTETALTHYNRESDIWYYLTNVFVNDLSDKNINEFLNKCYITDLCHIVPKHCGQIGEICNKLSIKNRDWKTFRTRVAKTFLLDEIKVVNPKFVILHGNPSRDFFEKNLGLKYTNEYKIENSIYSIKTGELNGFKIISIPHLKGDVRNKLWKCKKYPERPSSAKKILNGLTN
jgi:hypothetical protein